jgi:alpha-1,3-mannosyltransferase
MPNRSFKHEANSRTILGVMILDLGRDKAVSIIDDAFALGKRINVGFANAHALNLAYGNTRFRRALSRFLVLNDGLGTDIASRIKFGRPFIENLNGTDFVPDYLNRTKHRLRIYLIGTARGVVESAAYALSRSYPRHTIVGWRDGYFLGPHDIEQTCCDIRAASADCVLIGMGNPLQELWIDEHGHKTGANLFFAVGALLDFQAGAVQRAPSWIRRLRCEWTYRLLQEPSRLAYRYLVGNFIFLGRMLLDARR